MKDIDDVAESLKVQLGTALIPELTRLAVVFGDTAVKAIPPFIEGLHNVQAEIIRMAMLADKAGGSLTALGYFGAKTGEIGVRFMTLGQYDAGFGGMANRMDQRNHMYAGRYSAGDKELQRLANLEMGLDENGNPIVKKGKPEKSSLPSDFNSKSSGSESGGLTIDKLRTFMNNYYTERIETEELLSGAMGGMFSAGNKLKQFEPLQYKPKSNRYSLFDQGYTGMGTYGNDYDYQIDQRSTMSIYDANARRTE
jgi:hypothetical protein